MKPHVCRKEDPWIPCNYNMFSSRVCEVGSKGCTIQHQSSCCDHIDAELMIDYCYCPICHLMFLDLEEEAMVGFE
jgi:hypothetical protein